MLDPASKSELASQCPRPCRGAHRPLFLHGGLQMLACYVALAALLGVEFHKCDGPLVLATCQAWSSWPSRAPAALLCTASDIRVSAIVVNHHHHPDEGSEREHLTLNSHLGLRFAGQSPVATGTATTSRPAAPPLLRRSYASSLQHTPGASLSCDLTPTPVVTGTSPSILNTLTMACDALVTPASFIR